MPQVFIAYPYRERALAEQVARALTAEGVSVWFDEQQIRPGDEIASALQRGLQSAGAVVLVLGSQAYGDTWARKEAALALSQGKRIIPILPQRDAEIPYILRHLSYLDLSDEAGRSEKLQKLAKTLAEPWPESADPLAFSSARSETLAASAAEFEAEKVAYDKSRVLKNTSLAIATTSTLVSTVVSIAALLFGISSEDMPKYVYVAVGLVGSLTALALAMFVTRLYLHRSAKSEEAGRE